MFQSNSTEERKLFEIAWEVCNQVGGIYTVIRSKTPSVIQTWGDNYHAVGPWSEKAKAEFEHKELPDDALGATIREMWDEGYDVHYGKWLISGRPTALLFNYTGVDAKMGDFRYHYWEDHQIDTAQAEALEEDVIRFGFVVSVFFEKLAKHQEYINKKVILQFHEWMAAVPIPYIRKKNLDYKIVFTTHATMLGRYLAMNDPNFYGRIHTVNWYEEAKHFNILTKVQLERAAAHGAHVFTTVSRVTAQECEHLLGRVPDTITPNGLNIERFSMFHKVQVLHQELKKKIHRFTMGHFFNSYSFDLKKTMYFFTSGRYEYKNKGFDITLEALARLNHKLKLSKSEVTVVMFFVTKRDFYSLNPEVLQARAVMEELSNEVKKMSQEMADNLFIHAAQGSDDHGIPDLNDMISDYSRLRMRRTLQSWRSPKLPPVVTHNIKDDADDEILEFIRKSDMVNKPDDKVKIVYHPSFIAPENPLFGMDYHEFVRGCHLGIFPSYYEPWGYTPLECLASGVPAVTSDMAGFGDYVENYTAGNEADGIKVLKRSNKSFDDAAEELANYMFKYTQTSIRERMTMRAHGEDYSEEFDWKNLIKHYNEAYNL